LKRKGVKKKKGWESSIFHLPLSFDRFFCHTRVHAAVLMTAVSRHLSPSASCACVRARYSRNGESWWHPAHLLLIIRQLRRLVVAPVVTPMPTPALTPEPERRHGL